jgi:5-methyltetrahydrofolate--homocysteine methyltransferase
VPLSEIVAYLDERATFMGQWGLKSTRSGDQTYEELVETEGRPRLRAWLDRIQTEQIMEPAVVYGYWPCYSEGDDIVVLDPDSQTREIARFTFPRQKRDRFLCLADFIRPGQAGELDVIAFHLVTMGAHVSEVTAKLFAENAYRDYLELHGLSVQLTEAMAEYWHSRIRDELGIAGGDAPELSGILRQGYTGERYSFGYPACPDLDDRAKIVALLRPERIGVELSEELQLHPEQSTDALILHHPEAGYFNAR